MSVDYNYGKPKKNTSNFDDSKYVKKKKSGGFKWWYLLFIPGAIGILGAIFGDDNKSKDQPAPKTNIKENKKKKNPKKNKLALE